MTKTSDSRVTSILCGNAQGRRACALTLLATLGTLLVVSGCAGQPGAGAATDAAPLPAVPQAAMDARYATLRTDEGVLYQLEPAQSELRIYAFRAGSARQFGHNHVLSAPRFSGYALVAKPGAQTSRFDLEFRLDELALDAPEQRQALGQAFASRLTPQQVASTREHMLGAFGLQAEQFPLVRIGSLQIDGEAPKYVARIAVELHGQRRAMQVPLTVQATPDSLQVQGALVLQQSDFGIKPYTVLGGLLAVQDAVVVEFTLRGTATRR